MYPIPVSLDWHILSTYAVDDSTEPWAVTEVAWDMVGTELSPSIREVWEAVLRLQEARLVTVDLVEPDLEWSSFRASAAGRARVVASGLRAA